MTGDDRPSILFVSFRYPPETGAAATRLEALTTRWAERGHDVTVLTPLPDYPDGEVYGEYGGEWLRRETRRGVDVVTTRSPPAGPDDPLFRRMFKYLWFTVAAVVVGTIWLDRRDVVLATSPQPFAGLAGLVIARLRGAPFVFEVRDLWPESLVAMGEVDSALLIRTLDAVTNLLYARSDRVSVVAPGMKETLAEGGADYDDIWLHTNGIDHTMFDSSSDNAGASDIDEQERFEDRFVLSYVGTVGKAQGLEVVLDVAERLQAADGYGDIMFAFIGFGSRYDDLAAQANDRGLDNVVFLGRRPKSAVPDYLHASDAAFIHTEDETAFETMIPMKLYEALGAGLPVVLGAKGDAVEVLDRAEAGIAVTPGDPAAIEAAVKGLHDSPEMCQRYGENGREYVVRNHSWDAIAASYSDNLTRLAE